MRSLLAIADQTIRAAVRLRVFWALAALLLVVLLLIPPQLRDDATAAGRVRLLLTYGLGLSQGLLCLAMVWLGADALARDLEGGPIALLTTKPLPRRHLWLGRWLGLAALAAALVALVGGVVAVQLRVALASPRWTAEQRETVAAEILSAREVIAPELPDFDALAAERVASERAEGTLPADLPEQAALWGRRQALMAEWQTVAPGQVKEWVFPGADPPRGVPLRLRFRFEAARPVADDRAAGRFVVGAGGPAEAVQDVRLEPGEVHTLEFPADAADGGALTVRFRNDSDAALLFPVNEGPQVLYVVGGFPGNYARTLAVLWLQLVFLAALGLMAGSTWSFPVAAFVSLSYLVVALHASLVAGRLGQGRLLESDAPAWLEALAGGMMRFGLWLTSGLQHTWPIDELSGGLAVGWGDLARVALTLAVLQSGVVAGLGILLWSRRELGAGDEA